MFGLRFEELLCSKPWTQVSRSEQYSLRFRRSSEDMAEGNPAHKPTTAARALSYAVVVGLLGCWLFVTYWHTILVNKLFVSLSKTPLANDVAEYLGLESGATAVWQQYIGINYWVSTLSISHWPNANSQCSFGERSPSSRV